MTSSESLIKGSSKVKGVGNNEGELPENIRR